MSEHTKEPWKVTEEEGSFAIYSGETGNLTFIANVYKTDDRETGINNTKRIVSCVNEMQGLSTDELRKYGLGTAIGSEIYKLRSQRDELLAALKEIENWSSHTAEHSVDFGSNGVRDFYRAMAKRAISKCEAK